MIDFHRSGDLSGETTGQSEEELEQQRSEAPVDLLVAVCTVVQPQTDTACFPRVTPHCRVPTWDTPSCWGTPHSWLKAPVRSYPRVTRQTSRRWRGVALDQWGQERRASRLSAVRKSPPCSKLFQMPGISSTGCTG